MLSDTLYHRTCSQRSEVDMLSDTVYHRTCCTTFRGGHVVGHAVSPDMLTVLTHQDKFTMDQSSVLPRSKVSLKTVKRLQRMDMLVMKMCREPRRCVNRPSLDWNESESDWRDRSLSLSRPRPRSSHDWVFWSNTNSFTFSWTRQHADAMLSLQTWC